MKLIEGDTFKIKTKIGFGFLQYIETDELGVEFVRILEPILESGNLSQAEVDLPERWNIGFTLKIAFKRKLIEKVGSFEIPQSYINSRFARSEHNIRGEFLGWHIVNKLKEQKKIIEGVNVC